MLDLRMYEIHTDAAPCGVCNGTGYADTDSQVYCECYAAWCAWLMDFPECWMDGWTE